MHGGLEVRPSQGLEVWRVDVASRARNGAIVCWHKGLEVCGRGDVEAKCSCGESDACRSPGRRLFRSRGRSSYDRQLLVRPLYKQCLGLEWVEGSSVRGWTLVQACWTSARGAGSARASGCKTLEASKLGF